MQQDDRRESRARLEAETRHQAKITISKVKVALSKQTEPLLFCLESIVESKVSILRITIQSKDVSQIQSRIQELNMLLQCLEALQEGHDGKAAELLTESLVKV